MSEKLKPPVEVWDVPNEYRNLPCGGQCMYIDWHGPKNPLIIWICHPREAANRYSSLSSQRSCDFSRCPWQNLNGDSAGQQRLVVNTNEAVATVEDPRRRALNVNPENHRRATVRSIMEYSD